MEISYTIFDLLFYLLLYAFLGWGVRRSLLRRREKRAVCEPWLSEPAPEHALRHCRRPAAAGAGYHEP